MMIVSNKTLQQKARASSNDAHCISRPCNANNTLGLPPDSERRRSRNLVVDRMPITCWNVGTLMGKSFEVA
ncbi:unnamed protein product [Gordionus sp. m RMFG-2023]